MVCNRATFKHISQCMTFFVVTFLPQTGMPSDATEVKEFFYGFLRHVKAQSGIKKMREQWEKDLEN